MTYFGSPDWQDPRQPQSGADALGGGSVPSGGTTATISPTQSLGAYRRIFVTVTPDHACLVTCELTDSVSGVVYTFSRYTGGFGLATFALPCLGIVGDNQLTVIVTLSSNQVSSPAPITVQGLRQFPDFFRFDGLMPCQKSQVATWNMANGTITIIAAPSGQQRILLGKVTHPIGTVAAGQGFYSVFGNVGGAIARFGATFVTTTTTTVLDIDYGAGVLLDPAQPLQQFGSQGPGGNDPGAAWYDIVL